MPREYLQVDPRTLHVPSHGRYGIDPLKLARQKARYGDSIGGMPPVVVTRCMNGRLQIADGVTRAARAAELLPGTPITVEVGDEAPNRDVSATPTVGDLVL